MQPHGKSHDGAAVTTVVPIPEDIRSEPGLSADLALVSCTPSKMQVRFGGGAGVKAIGKRGGASSASHTRVRAQQKPTTGS